MPRPLRDHFHHRRREIRVRIYRHVVERDHATNDDEDGEQQHQEPLPQRELDDVMNHSKLAPSVLQRIGKLKKQAAIAHNSFSSGNALQNLRLTVLALTDLHIASAKLIRTNGDIDKWLIVVIAQNG